MHTNIFVGKYFFIDSINIAETLKLKEAIEKCGGVVENVLNSNVTHIVVQNERHSYYRCTLNKSVRIVSHSWVFICANFKKMVPSNRYSPDKRSRLIRYNSRTICNNQSQNTNSGDSLNRKKNPLFDGKQFGTLSLYEEDSIDRTYCEQLHDTECHVFYNFNRTLIDTKENINQENDKSWGMNPDLCVSIPVRTLIKLMLTVENTNDTRLSSVIDELKVYLNSSILGCGKLLDVLYSREFDKYNGGNPVVKPVLATPSGNLKSILKNKISAPEKNVEDNNKSTIVCHRVPLGNLNRNDRLILKDGAENNEKNKTKNEHRPPRRDVEIENSQQLRGSSSLFDTCPAKSHPVAKRGIVCTYFNQRDLKTLYSIIRQLGVFEIEENVTDRTTHVICDGEKKTLNLYKALARGCWVLNKQWVISSSESNRWLYEEKYERIDLNPNFRELRITKQVYGLTYSSDLFADCGSIYVGDNGSFNKFELSELISVCDGKILSNHGLAEIVIGTYPVKKFNLKVDWVFNSIWNNRLCDMERYRIK